MCQLNFVVRLLTFKIYDEVHQSLITHQQHDYLVTCLFLSSSFNKEIVSRSVPISWWQSLSFSVPLFATIKYISSLVPTPKSTYSVDDTPPVCVSMLTHSLVESRVMHWRLWLIILSRASISSLMIDKSCPKF